MVKGEKMAKSKSKTKANPILRAERGKVHEFASKSVLASQKLHEFDRIL